MNRRFSAMTALLFTNATLVAGCGGEDSSSDDQAAPKCPANATTNTEGGYCLVLPDGFGQKSALSQGENRRSYGYGDTSADYLNVEVAKTGDEAAFETELALFARNDAAHSEYKSEELPGGATMISFIWKGDGLRQTTYLVRNDSKFIVCWANSRTADAPVLSACRSLVVQ